MLKVTDQHRLKVPTGAYVQGMHWHRVLDSPGANVCSEGTGLCHYPVSLMHGPIGTGSWFQPVSLIFNWYRFLARRNFPALGAGQEYRLLLKPVPMPSISTGCNMCWYFWPGPLAHFLVVWIILHWWNCSPSFHW